jgi:hypothetical protein
MNIRRAACGSHGARSEQIVLPDAHAYRDRRKSVNPFTPTIPQKAAKNPLKSRQAWEIGRFLRFRFSPCPPVFAKSRDKFRRLSPLADFPLSCRLVILPFTGQLHLRHTPGEGGE